MWAVIRINRAIAVVVEIHFHIDTVLDLDALSVFTLSSVFSGVDNSTRAELLGLVIDSGTPSILSFGPPLRLTVVQILTIVVIVEADIS